ncbi:Conserved_hypothetical protein [Hexamita inflata]|uniref:Uncharacterized protein n=1 Tax=Hexamita inflata TaxID=28002 RepID=A0AA86PC00_9EUKA|nr:Conserved hypothetical protein [Hexamita inflata]
MKKMANRFEVLNENPDLKPQEVIEKINLPEENQSIEKISNQIPFSTFSANILSFDFTRSVLENFKSFVKNCKNVSLPEKVNAQDYAVYYVTSKNETKIFERKNTMQSDFTFPFSFLRSDLQAKLLNWKIEPQELDELLVFSIAEMKKLYSEHIKQEAGMALAHRIFIQMITKKKPTLLNKYLNQYITQFDPQVIIKNPRYFNFICWLFAQADNTTESYGNVMQLFLSLWVAILNQMEQKKKFTEDLVLHNIYQILLMIDFFNARVKNQAKVDPKLVISYQQVLLSSIFLVERMSQVNLVGETTIANIAQFNKHIDILVAESDAKESFQTLVLESVRLQVLPSERVKQILLKLNFSPVQLTAQVIEFLQLEQFAFLKELKQYQNLKVIKKPVPTAKKQIINKVEVEEDKFAINWCSMLWFATVLYVAMICLLFDEPSQFNFKTVMKPIMDKTEVVFEFVQKLVKAYKGSVQKML